MKKTINTKSHIPFSDVLADIASDAAYERIMSTPAAKHCAGLSEHEKALKEIEAILEKYYPRGNT